MALKDWRCTSIWQREGYAKNGWRWPSVGHLDEHDMTLVMERLYPVKGVKPHGAGYYYDDPRGNHKLVGSFATLNEAIAEAEKATEKLKP